MSRSNCIVTMENDEDIIGFGKRRITLDELPRVGEVIHMEDEEGSKCPVVLRVKKIIHSWTAYTPRTEWGPNASAGTVTIQCEEVQS